MCTHNNNNYSQQTVLYSPPNSTTCTRQWQKSIKSYRLFFRLAFIFTVTDPVSVSLSMCVCVHTVATLRLLPLATHFTKEKNLKQKYYKGQQQQRRRRQRRRRWWRKSFMLKISFIKFRSVTQTSSNRKRWATQHCNTTEKYPFAMREINKYI